MSANPMDRAPDAVVEAADDALHSVGRLWQLAFTAGVREGMAISATGVQACIDTLDEMGPSAMAFNYREFMHFALSDLRDRLRTEALAVPDPDPVPRESTGDSDDDRDIELE